MKFLLILFHLLISALKTFFCIKRCYILKDTFRNHITGFDDAIMEIACSLHNLRVRHRYPYEQFDHLEFDVNSYLP